MDVDYYCDLAYDSPAESEDSSESLLSIEDWQDWNSEELLNLWMSIVQYHEDWYLPLRKTFNEFCEFVFQGQELALGQEDRDTSLDKSQLLDKSSDLDKSEDLDAPPPEIQAIKDHPFIKGLDWDVFFFSKH